MAEIQVTLTNNETGSIKRGQAISGLLFTVNGLGAPTAFTELKGRQKASVDIGAGGSWTGADGTSFDDTSAASPPNAIDHWGFATSGLNVTLSTVNSPGATGNPVYMILPASGTGSSSGKSFAQGNFDPYILGPGNFFLTLPGITSSTNLVASEFTGVQVRFGTNPDATLDVMTSVPLPAAAWMGMGTLGAMGMAAKVRRRRSA